MSHSTEPVIITSTGPVIGKAEGCSAAFLGIPFGKAGRFLPPEPVGWSQVRECFSFGAAPPQPNYWNKKQPGQVFSLVGDEDCLNLNVWTADLDPAEPLPVVVLVYGGAFQAGSNAFPDFRGDRFMGREKMVVVSVNYRVGVLGFLELGHIYGEAYAGSGNNGIRDLLLAFDWVYENIRAFGGDPDRITLAGISAGAKAIGSLITLPQIQQRCHSVIMESGAMQAFRSVETAQKPADRFLSRFPAGTDLRTLPTEKVVEEQGEFCSRDGNTCFFGPVLTAPFAPDWKERWEKGERFTGAAIIGCGRHELIPLASKPDFPLEAETVADDLFGTNGTIAKAMAAERLAQGMDTVTAWEPVLSDFMYRYYSDGLAKKLSAEGNRVYCYSFEYGLANHGMGYAYLMRSLDYGGVSLSGDKLAEAGAVADFMRSQVWRFVETGAPDPALWPAYDGARKMIFDACPHMEERPEDTLSGFPDEVYAL